MINCHVCVMPTDTFMLIDVQRVGKGVPPYNFHEFASIAFCGKFENILVCSGDYGNFGRHKGTVPFFGSA